MDGRHALERCRRVIYCLGHLHDGELGAWVRRIVRLRSMTGSLGSVAAWVVKDCAWVGANRCPVLIAARVLNCGNRTSLSIFPRRLATAKQ